MVVTSRFYYVSVMISQLQFLTILKIMMQLPFKSSNLDLVKKKKKTFNLDISQITNGRHVYVCDSLLHLSCIYGSNFIMV